LLLEPNSNPAAKTYQKAIFEQGIPLTAFAVDDIQKEYARMRKRGVEFVMEPTHMGPTPQPYLMILATHTDYQVRLIRYKGNARQSPAHE
jgi:hypothetical protein